MNNETREQIALARYKLLSPILAEPGRVQNAYFRQQAEREHCFPHVGVRRYSMSAFKLWLKRYRDEGFDGLKPKSRKDKDSRRRQLGAEALAFVQLKASEEEPRWTRIQLYEYLLARELLGEPPLCYNTLLRILKRDALWPHPLGRNDVRKRFELAEVNELWVGDFMHGPKVRCGRSIKKAILCAILDDHSRMVVGAAFGVHETVSAVVVVFKDALLTFGITKRFYLDNGPAFCADLLVSCCARLGISLIHSKPYDPPSRGKIERFFRTVRQRFLPNVAPDCTLDELNIAFAAWLRDQYHHKLHAGIEQRPVDRYQASANRTSIRRLSGAELDELFLVRHERTVNNDATISFRSQIFEVPAAYIRQRVELRHPVDQADELYLYDNGARVARLRLVDKHENARTFAPTTSADALRFADRKVSR